MSRPRRLQYPGAVYHLTARGNARQRIFWDDWDHETFLKIFAQVIDRFRWLCHAYCLMGNHYHLLIETPAPTLSSGMRQLNGLYTQVFNRRRRRAGHLFQGRFKAIVVQKESHLLELCRYVVLNPVRARPGRRLEDWKWSSYRATAGLDPVPDFLVIDWVLGQFAPRRSQAQAQYRAFVQAGLRSRPWEQLRGQIYLGDEPFITRHATVAQEVQEIPRTQWRPARPPLEELFRTEGAHAIAAAYREYGYRMREIAEFMGVHYATVSRRLRALEEARRDV